MFKTIIAAALMAGGLIIGGAASAATVTFAAGSFVDETGTTKSIFDVVITDISGGVNVAVTQHSNLANGDVLLIGLEGPNLAGATFDAKGTATIAQTCINREVNDCGGGGGGFNGGAFNLDKAFGSVYGFFDTILRIGTTGGSGGGGFNNNFNIDITGVIGLAAMNFEAVGLRIQSTTGVNATSLKIYSDDPTTPIPVPAGGLLLLTALAGAGVVARRRKTA